ncbi:MAG: hypothetical protein CO108_17215 [Deltaproteobacteria bacterium CG_4_9_14_3_um_filter_63_12]|nr:MAG: hypothetical protein CO108_17215 [Deltaproteobacteria bacterium CG_4_9_14_3_um_filter_63_12]
MRQETDPRDGDIIEYLDKGRLRLAVILAEDGNKKRYRAVSEDSRELVLTLRQVTHALPKQLSPTLSHEQLGQELKSIRLRAEQLVVNVDASDLWELLVGEMEEVELSTLADLAHGEVSAVTCLSTASLLRDDTIYFKHRKDSLYEPRNHEQVEALKAELAVQERRTQSREVFLETLVKALDSTPDERGTEFDKVMTDPLLRRYMEMLLHLAVAGENATDTGEACELLEDLQARLDHRLKGHASRKAFHLLVELGHFSPDENLFLLRHQLPAEFDDVLEEAAAALVAEGPRRLREALELGARRDLTSLNLFSIDDLETQDVDDALSITRIPWGWELGVHIADPCFHIAFDSPLELEARRRGATLYLPDRRIPMFPVSLSEGLFSLQVGELRPALSFLFELDDNLNVGASSIVQSLVRVSHKLDYEGVEDRMEHGSSALDDDLRKIYEVADLLAHQRMADGAVSIDIPECKVRVDDDGRIWVRQRGRDAVSRMMVSELMVLANACAADFCVEHHLPAPFRTQEEPDPPMDERDFEHIPEGLALAFALRRCMPPAITSTHAGPHFSLGLPAYTQATSPIRRYQDLLTHFLLHGFLREGRVTIDGESAHLALSQADAAMQSIRNVERDSGRYWMLRYLEETLDQVREATVVEYVEKRGDAALVVVHDTMMRVRVSLTRRVPLGEVVQVVVNQVNPRADTVAFRLAT